LDCDVPWINTRCKPKPDAKIYHIDVDPLKQQMPVFYIDALARYRADSAVAIEQINEYLGGNQQIQRAMNSDEYGTRWEKLQESHKALLDSFESTAQPAPNGYYSTAFLCRKLREVLPKNTIWAIEAVTQTLTVADQIQATIPGSWINCGGGGLGWSGGGEFSMGIDFEAQAMAKTIKALWVSSWHAKGQAATNSSVR
jgi:thiamine pyrophosphate-dependent acetolactate synthase large subunit-like protein